MEQTIRRREYRFEGSDRIREHSPPKVNESIDLLTGSNIRFYERRGLNAMKRRIRQLDREWDVDRAVMLSFALLGGVAFSLGVSGRRRRFGLLGPQAFFLGWHAFAGWSPPIPVLRRLGFRTRKEIDAEKYALKSKISEMRDEELSTTDHFSGAA